MARPAGSCSFQVVTTNPKNLLGVSRDILHRKYIGIILPERGLRRILDPKGATWMLLPVRS